MGVMNFTPNSFSDGGELDTPEKIQKRLEQFGNIDALDIGAESTAPMNEPISHETEWQRLEPVIPLIKETKNLSLDTYHPETVFKLYEILKRPFIWNDVSGKFDESVERFLSLHPDNLYVFSHNLAPSRELTGKHMNYLSNSIGQEFLEEVAAYFLPFKDRARVIFDPCFGFSKNYEQNWYLLENFAVLQARVKHSDWMLGISRKAFLRKKLGIQQLTEDTKRDLDFYHQKVLEKLNNTLTGTVWVRTHRPELV